MSDNNKEVLRGKMEEFLHMHGYPTDKHFSCINPDHLHNKNTPSMIYRKDKGKVRCYGYCNSDFDIFDLVGFIYGLKNFNDKIRKLEELFHLEPSRPGKGKEPLVFLGSDFLKRSGLVSSELESNLHKSDFSDPVQVQENGSKERIHNRLKEINSSLRMVHKAADYLATRGINRDLAYKYFVGYWSETNLHDVTCRVLVLPCDENHYSIRFLGTVDGSEYKGERYEKRGKGYAVFGADSVLDACQSGRPLFVTEGELDTLSIITAGGLSVAIRGKNVEALYPVLDAAVSETGKKPIIITACDNDPTGRNINSSLKQTLVEKGFEVHWLNIFGGCKDANDALQANVERFFRYIRVSQTVDGLKKLLAVDDYQRKNLSLSAAGRVYYGRSSYERVRSGFTKLDYILGGGFAPFLYILGANSSLGKTSLVLQIADYIAGNGRDVMYFSYEMSQEELCAKSLSRLMYVHCRAERLGHSRARSYMEIIDGKVAPDEKPFLDYAYNHYISTTGQHLIIVDEPVNIDVVCEKVKIHSENFGKAPMVIVDYIQIVPVTNENASAKSAVDEIVSKLGNICKKYRTPVLAISSYNRGSYSKREADMGSFKETSLIEYSANSLMSFQLCGQTKDGFNYKKALASSPRYVEICFLKQRGGFLGKVQFAFVAKYSYLREFEYDKEDNDVEDRSEETLTEFEKLIDSLNRDTNNDVSLSDTVKIVDVADKPVEPVNKDVEISSVPVVNI